MRQNYSPSLKTGQEFHSNAHNLSHMKNTLNILKLNAQERHHWPMECIRMLKLTSEHSNALSFSPCCKKFNPKILAEAAKEAAASKKKFKSSRLEFMKKH